jgi:hypothetical protein
MDPHSTVFLIAALLFGIVLLTVALILFVTLGIQLITSRFLPIDLSAGNLVSFLKDLPTSAGQLQKAYDWNISQWSNFGTTLLTGTLGFITTCLVAFYKGEIKHLTITMLVGVAAALCLYLKSQIEINKLKNQFMYWYSLLSKMYTLRTGP